jgi:formate dehydrogenase major subunit
LGGPNARLQRDALRKLDWLVVFDLFESESASVWYADPQGPDPASIATEVFLFPVATITEKSGSLTNTERLVQWHEKAIEPPGDCRSDLWYVYQLGKRLKVLYADSTLPRDAALRNLTWEYASAGTEEPDPEQVLREINGYFVATGEHLKGIAELKGDGSTACGSRLYAGVFPAPGQNLSKRLDGQVTESAIFADWGWAWPANTRVLYNRASADPAGKPWSERKKLLWWDAAVGKWTGYDHPNFDAAMPPDYRPGPEATGGEATAGDAPFTVHWDGRGWLFAPYGMTDGPLPVYYEPLESPFRNTLVSTQFDPLTVVIEDAENPIVAPADPDYPLVATTYRVTEHYLSGMMTRHDGWLNELQPAMFFEISPELAAERGLKNLDWAVASTPRDDIEAQVLVTERMQPLLVDGRPAHVVGMIWHFGYKGEAVGDTANDLSPMALAPNADIQGTKSFVCQLRAGRLTKPRPLTPEPPGPLPLGLPVDSPVDHGALRHESSERNGGHVD